MCHLQRPSWATLDIHIDARVPREPPVSRKTLKLAPATVKCSLKRIINLCKSNSKKVFIRQYPNDIVCSFLSQWSWESFGVLLWHNDNDLCHLRLASIAPNELCKTHPVASPNLFVHLFCLLILILCLLAQSFLQSGAKFNFTSNLGRLFKLTKTSDHPDNLK